jgi:hypothetical protein
LAAVILGLATIVFIGLKVSGLELMNGLLPPEVLQHKAHETLDKLGYSGPAVDHAAAFGYDTGFTDYVHDHFKPRPDWPTVLAQRPQVLEYYYRQSPTYLAQGRYNYFLRADVITFDDPPPTQSGMINIKLDAQGRLSYLQAIPKEVEANPSPAQTVDWKPLFAAAGLDPAQFKKTEPNWLSLASFDERAAWTGSWPGSDFPLRIEAAAWRGKPVFFHLIGPWTKPDRTQYEYLTAGQHAGAIIELVLALSLLGGGALVAWRNYVKGKSDARGALRLAGAAFMIDMALWVCLEHFIPTLETFAHFLLAVSKALFLATVIWMLYVALEPYVRRHWPQAIISWSRLLQGGLRDPLVGRDLLWGVLLGVLWSLTIGVAFLFLKREGATPQLAQTELLLGSREMVGLWLDRIIQSIMGTLQFFFVLFLLRVVLRNRWLALVCFIAIFTLKNTLWSDHPQIVWPFWLIVYALAAVAVSRFGLIVLAAASFTANILLNLPYSLNFSNWYAGHAIAILAGFAALAAWGFYTSLGGQKLWKDELFE